MVIAMTRREFIEKKLNRLVNPSVMMAIKQGGMGVILGTDKPGFAKHDIMQNRSKSMVSEVTGIRM